MITSKLHVLMTRFSLASLIVLSSLSLSSCQDEDYGFTKDEVRASVYKRNFEGTYGKIDPDQTWDFSSYNLRKLGLTGGPSTGTRAALTRAAIPDLVTKYNSSDKWYTVSAKTTTWLNQNLKEKVNNTKYVSSFNWEKVADSDPLYIIPIYQGQTGMIWDLELVDLDNHTSSIIWSKSENIQYTQHYAQWDEFFYESWKADEAPNTSLKNKNDVDDNKLMTLKFSKPLSALPPSFTNTNDIIAAFTISKNIPGNFMEGSNEIKAIPGAFYIKPGEDGTLTKITSENCEDFFTNDVNKKFVKNASAGLFQFTSAGNFELNADRYLNSSEPNKVMLNVLLGKTISNHEITVGDLKTLQFIIDKDLFDYPYGTDDKFNHDYTFNTWSADRIRVFIKYDEGGTGTTVNLERDATNQYTEHHTINKLNVQTRPIKIDITKLSGTNFALNLKTKYRGDGDKELSDIGDDHRSDMGYMSQINHFADDDKPIDEDALVSALGNFGINDLSDGFEYMVIGCEDAGANGKKSDNDFNDLVLLVVGKTLPTQTIRKRYMIEDLGSTLDFDFNDIVVDVTEHVANTPDGKKYTQTAAIRHLRGTIPFRVKIGNQGTFGAGDNNGKIMRGHNIGELTYDPSLVDAINANYKWEHTVIISGSSGEKIAKLDALRSNYWNPDANNIYVEVWPSYNSENSNLSDVFWTGADASKEDNSGAIGNNVQNRKIVEFPKTGTVPYIIAVDPTVMWMKENISIPEYWIETRPGHFNNGFTQSDQTQDNIPAVPGIFEGGNKLNNTTSLPAGNFALSNTSTDITASNRLNIPAYAFNDVYVDDEIIIHVDGDKVYDKSRLDFKPTTEAIKKIGADGSIVVTGDYAIKVTQSLLNDLQANGLQIGGQYVTVTSVDVKSDGGAKIQNGYDVAESAYKLSNQRTVIRSYSNSVTLSNSELQKLYVGDKIVVHVDNLRENSKLGFKKSTDGWPAFDYDGGLLINESEITNGTGSTQSNNVKVTGDIILKVNNDNIDDIKNGSGLVINGQYITIKSVDIQNAINNSAPLSQGSIKLDEGKHVITSYSNVFTISAEKFRYLGAGDKIIFHVSSLRNGSNSQSVLGVHYDYENPQNDNKRDNVPGFVNNEYGNIFGVTKDVELTITGENIEKMQQYGLFINGVNITVDAVTVDPSQNLLWNDASGLSVETNKAFDKFAYGGQQKLFNLLPSSGSVKLRFYFKEPVSGNITFFTPHSGVDESGALTGGWTPFDPSRSDNLNNYGYYDITFNQTEIDLIKSRGGLILQNNDIVNFAVVAVRKM